MLSTGDLVRITVVAASRDEADALLESVPADPELGGRLSPIPNRTAGSEPDFGALTLVQEFILAAGAELTAEAIIAGVRALVSRWRNQTDEKSPAGPPHQVEVTASVSAEGVCEVEVRLVSRGLNRGR